MGFIDSYKHLEQICGDSLRDSRRVSAYIDEMKNKPSGSHLVKGWDNDLKQLEHYRWVRNRIAHDPGCSEENMCKAGDALWLDNFYARIMNQTDPLALYYRAMRLRAARKPPRAAAAPHPSHTVAPRSSYAYDAAPQDCSHPQKSADSGKSSHRVAKFLIGLACVLTVAAVIFVVCKVAD